MHLNLNQTVECMYPWHIVNQLPYSEKVRHGKLFVLLYNMSYSQLNANSFVNFSSNRFNLYLLGKADTAWYLLRNQNFFWNFRTANTNLKILQKMPMLWFREIITSAILIHLIQVYQNQFDSTTLTTFVWAYLYFWHFYHAETEGGCRDKVMHRDTIYMSFIHYTKRAGYLTICTMYSLQNMKHAAVDSW